jgi:type II secretory pathway component PulF
LVRQSEAAWLATTPASGRFGHALVELGQSLQSIALRRLELRTILATTLGTVVVGLVVATTVLAIFTPLIELISWITP